ncbi:hypothetical protein KRP22_003583 [Phytophthora ramorum]|uniref:Uncharacterized protein n=1 Tax=Phytophthora ramorum TaxID=164328 RepID=H3GBC7_PHYRM|nr:Protein unc-45-like protein B [Phytophthora ramorum]KAH7500259.1 Protein unc-45-like protein B [Phytophthora ramorum]
MDALEALKSEGNALFQQQRFPEAVQVYTSALAELQNAEVVTDVAEQFETAVRLNRAWARIQMPGDEAVLAEEDCSAVIQKNPSCVKAFYRRALARERRGLWKVAMEDAAIIKHLEPGNPSLGSLLERLQQHIRDEEDLAPKLCHLSINGDSGHANAGTSSIDLAREAEEAWLALQADEMSFKKVYHTTTEPRRKPKKLLKAKEIAQNVMKREISEKTDDVWASLRREEATTVAKAFPRSRKSRQVG